MNAPESKPLVTIVEDDFAIAEGLALNLKLQGFRTLLATDGEAAHALIQEHRPDLVLLDISLPKQSGLWVLEQLRQVGNHVPVIVLSARQDEFDKVAALTLGADDYVTKPFALAELMARVTAVLRRASLTAERAATLANGGNGGNGGNAANAANAAPGDATAAATQGTPPPEAAPPEAPLGFADVSIDLGTRTVWRKGQEVKLTHLEFELLVFLCRHPARVFSRDELLRHVWGARHAGTARTVDNFVAQLRAKLEADPEHPCHLLTVRGSGYRFVRGPS
jgi:DNA-binding response OmpR family regulator